MKIIVIITFGITLASCSNNDIDEVATDILVPSCLRADSVVESDSIKLEPVNLSE